MVKQAIQKIRDWIKWLPYSHIRFNSWHGGGPWYRNTKKNRDWIRSATQPTPRLPYEVDGVACWPQAYNRFTRKAVSIRL